MDENCDKGCDVTEKQMNMACSSLCYGRDGPTTFSSQSCIDECFRDSDIWDKIKQHCLKVQKQNLAKTKFK